MSSENAGIIGRGMRLMKLLRLLRLFKLLPRVFGAFELALSNKVNPSVLRFVKTVVVLLAMWHLCVIGREEGGARTAPRARRPVCACAT
jgi:hypothetical protein